MPMKRSQRETLYADPKVTDTAVIALLKMIMYVLYIYIYLYVTLVLTTVIINREALSTTLTSMNPMDHKKIGRIYFDSAIVMEEMMTS
jgi:hypothetical protein